MATTVEQTNLVLRVRAGTRGRAYWDAQWRSRAVEQPWQLKKRRLGLAWQEQDAEGNWRKRRGHCPEGWLDEPAANVAAVAAMEQHTKELELEAHRRREEAEHKVTVRERWYWPVPALTGLLSPDPASPGSGCRPLHRTAATARRWGPAPHTIQRRLMAHDLILKRAGEPGVMPGPRDRAHHHAVAPATHPRRLGLDKRKRRPEIQRPPPSTALTQVISRRSAPADPAAITLPPVRLGAHDHLPFIAQPDVLHDRSAQPERCGFTLPPSAQGCANSPASWLDTSMRRPFRRPCVTSIARRSPRWTWCNTVWRATPRAFAASSRRT